ncbi:hypothetical protein CfE428DRAFT_5891 [Chthoniobacter flavus Ellin428]|uniref:Uncharacterized protein n=1 Tax=Chthoniobacter flavus Ellin428 TaxID=497964 RepID=B4DAF0_9BACT|nr:hypothetical protein [Chthoniobacter flavus]EDY16611.1 hypothetical protein CfE428DRAFT_5891 [Chthoniobacter flavus Ellin428]TCO91970.1 hypothetical protein EV701_107251 [Chthoniobacter flavus]
MSEQFTSERDSLLEAIRLAAKEVAEAQEARQQAEGKVSALQVQMDRQYTAFVFMRSRLEKMGVPVDSWDEDLDKQIKLLESQYEQSLAENRRLRELLEETVTEDVSQPAPEATPMPAEQVEAPGEPEMLIDIEASPRHTNRFRR